MRKYHKIESVYKRDPDNNHKTFLAGQYSRQEFEMLRDIEWQWTEKIDGTNIRVGITQDGTQYGGRTDNAQIPAHLVEHLRQTFPKDTRNKVVSDMTLYGEGYGEKIQKGGDYIPGGVGFILFDVLVGDTWLARENVEEIAGALGIPVVPVVGVGTLLDAVEFAEKGFMSAVAKRDRRAEGIIARPRIEILDRLGRRVITKIKEKDFGRD